MECIDQIQRIVNLPNHPPQRIVSLVPSITELLFDLGLGEKVIGITRFCVLPKVACESKFKVGGTKDFDVQKIIQLQPDIVFANKEENTLEGIAQLEKHCPVWVSNIPTVDAALQMMASIGEMTNTSIDAKKMIAKIESDFKELNFISKKAIYLIWNHPIMTIGGDTFISDMMQKSGFENIYNKEKRYPTLTENELIDCSPEVLILSTEPYAFKHHHVDYYQNLLPHTKIVIADGQIYSWYGSRLLFAKEYFEKINRQLN